MVIRLDSSRTQSTARSTPNRRRYFKNASFENLESRVYLAADVTACLDDSPQAEETHAQATRAINCLGYDLYEQMRQTDGNLLFSPTSVSTVLSMLYAGTNGDTASQMADSLHLEDDGIHESFRALTDLLERDIEHDLSQANAVWPAEQFQLRPGYVEQIANDYGGTSQSLDYSQPAARETINGWVEDQTEGNIQDLIKELPGNTLMTLTNAIYFNALWELPFDPSHTAMRRFTRADGTTVNVPMMDTSGVVDPRPYTRIDDFHLVELPYVGGDASMVILVPAEGHSANDMTMELLSQAVEWDGDGDEAYVQVRMPKFNTTVGTDLKPLLAELGMPMTGDYTRMADGGDGLMIDQVGHKAFIEANEQGTQAAAATFASLILCFAKGTPVLTPDGAKPIEELKAGDLVLARNEFDVNAPVEPKRIEEVFENRAEVISMRIGGQVIRTTREHRFFEKQRGWTAAEDLKSGDQLSLAENGKWETVAEVDTIASESEIYNFRVADHHTYFVGDDEWGFALWTHNSYAEFTIEADQPFHYFIRDNATDAILFLGRVSDPSPSENEFTITRTVPAVPNGDTDNDLDVDFDDFLNMSRNFGRSVWNSPPSSIGDFNRDLVVDFDDFLILSANFGRAYEPLPVG